MGQRIRWFFGMSVLLIGIVVSGCVGVGFGLDVYEEPITVYRFHPPPPAVVIEPYNPYRKYRPPYWRHRQWHRDRHRWHDDRQWRHYR